MFKTAVDASKIPAASMPILAELAQSATGRKPTTVAIISDDTPAAQGATKAFSGVLAQQNMEIVVNESFTPPISDATPIVQRVRSRKPDLILLLPSAAPNVVQFVNKFVEFKINTATIALGNLIASPDMRNLIEAKMLDRQMTIIGNWTGKQSQERRAALQESVQRGLDDGRCHLQLRGHVGAQGGDRARRQG